MITGFIKFYIMPSIKKSVLHIAVVGPMSGPSEKNGQVYTCKAGHIDLAHLRKSADWTAVLAKKTFKCLMKDKRKFSFELREPSTYYVTLTYPDNWKGKY